MLLVIPIRLMSPIHCWTRTVRISLSLRRFRYHWSVCSHLDRITSNGIRVRTKIRIRIKIMFEDIRSVQTRSETRILRLCVHCILVAIGGSKILLLIPLHASERPSSPAIEHPSNQSIRQLSSQAIDKSSNLAGAINQSSHRASNQATKQSSKSSIYEATKQSCDQAVICAKARLLTTAATFDCVCGLHEYPRQTAAAATICLAEVWIRTQNVDGHPIKTITQHKLVGTPIAIRLPTRFSVNVPTPAFGPCAALQTLVSAYIRQHLVTPLNPQGSRSYNRLRRCLVAGHGNMRCVETLLGNPARTLCRSTPWWP